MSTCICIYQRTKYCNITNNRIQVRIENIYSSARGEVWENRNESIAIICKSICYYLFSFLWRRCIYKLTLNQIKVFFTLQFLQVLPLSSFTLFCLWEDYAKIISFPLICFLLSVCQCLNNSCLTLFYRQLDGFFFFFQILNLFPFYQLDHG